MPMQIEMDHRDGVPPAPALVVAAFSAQPWSEVWVYYDGRRFGPGAQDWLHALGGLKLGDPVPWPRRLWSFGRGELLYWRAVTIDPDSGAKALRDAMKQAGLA